MAETASELYGIVINGAMNPRIHHPAWYVSANILTADEIDTAFGKGMVTCTHMVSAFKLDHFLVQCLPDRWEIQTSDPANIARMRDIACATFHVLMHTPVAAFGFNFHFLRRTPINNARTRLASMVNNLPLGRRRKEADDATIVTASTRPDGALSETISSVSELDDFIRVIFNAHHAVNVEEGKLFDLTPLLRDAFEQDYPECLSRADEIAAAFSRSHEE
jgi:hypothetical protein